MFKRWFFVLKRNNKPSKNEKGERKMKRKIKALLKNEKGMTLIELLAVIVILGIIAAIAIPSIGNIIENSKIDAIKADAQQILSAARMYEADAGVKIDGTNGVTEAELEAYLDDLTTFPSVADAADYTVKRTSDGLELTATGTKGNTTVNFTGATQTEIDGAKKGVTTIGK